MIFNTFIFGAMFGWALFPFARSATHHRRVDPGVRHAGRSALPEFVTRAISPWCCFSHMNFAIGCITICHCAVSVGIPQGASLANADADHGLPRPSGRLRLFANMMSVVVGAAAELRTMLSEPRSINMR